MKIGYVRVSTIEQNEARQIEAMKTDGVEKIYMDKKSGKDFNRPEYQKMIASLHKGDILITILLMLFKEPVFQNHEWKSNRIWHQRFWRNSYC